MKSPSRFGQRLWDRNRPGGGARAAGGQKEFDGGIQPTYRSVSFLMMPVPPTHNVTRQQILQAALQRFAHGGYAATSVQQIVDAAQVSKPAMYYYFKDKAGLFQALVMEAHDERYRRMQGAAARVRGTRDQLVEILVVLFDYFREHRELMRLSLATAFAAAGEVPPGCNCADRCERNFEFVHALIKQGQARGELSRSFDSRELAFGFYGQANAYLMAHLLMPQSQLERPVAEQIVKLFLTGAGPRRKARPTAKKPARKPSR
jgi:TetR/AcrR family transcriptional regulator